jgi:hypothetical protein
VSKLRIACLDFWRGFEPGELVRRLPELAQAIELAGLRLELVPDAKAADLVVFSCFPDGRKTLRPRDPRAWTGTRAARLFYTGENVDPNLAQCDFALSFRRDVADPRHLRVPNYVTTQRLFGFAHGALLQPPADPAAMRRAKTRFCAYVQRHRVPLREEFVRRLSRYKRVDCAGPSLFNTGFTVSRAEKYELYRTAKFAVCFENEAAVGYTTEKLPDALLSDCVPLYWGDPTVHQDFDPGCFVHLRDFASLDAMVARIVELDRDDDAYDALLGARRYPPRPGAPAGALPPHADPAELRAFFARCVAAVRGVQAGAA